MTMIMVAPIDAPDGALFGYGINQLTGERIATSALTTQPDPAIRLPSGSGDQMHTLIVQDSDSYSDLMNTSPASAPPGSVGPPRHRYRSCASKRATIPQSPLPGLVSYARRIG